LSVLAGRIFIENAICEKTVNNDIWLTGNLDKTLIQVMGKTGEDKRRFSNTSSTNLPKPKTDIPAKPVQKFTEGQILDAKVSNIKGVEVTYQVLDGTKKTTKEHKQAKLLEEEQNVKVKITALKDDGSIKNIKYYE